MADVEREILAERFAALQAERARTWPPSQLAANAEQRQALREGFDPHAAVRVGDRLPPAEVHGIDGALLTIDALATGGAAVLIFFRFAGCPADNLALPYYDRHLTAVLAADGVPVVAISPQVPERLSAIRDAHALGLTVASDPDNRLARALGLTFVPLDRPEPPAAGWIGEVTGTGTWELPLTSVVVVDAGRVARFVAISPDWLDRIEAEPILRAVRALRAPATAAA